MMGNVDIAAPKYAGSMTRISRAKQTEDGLARIDEAELKTSSISYMKAGLSADSREFY
jgi:hypothetical protein